LKIKCLIFRKITKQITEVNFKILLKKQNTELFAKESALERKIEKLEMIDNPDEIIKLEPTFCNHCGKTFPQLLQI